MWANFALTTAYMVLLVSAGDKTSNCHRQTILSGLHQSGRWLHYAEQPPNTGTNRISNTRPLTRQDLIDIRRRYGENKRCSRGRLFQIGNFTSILWNFKSVSAGRVYHVTQAVPKRTRQVLHRAEFQNCTIQTGLTLLWLFHQIRGVPFKCQVRKFKFEVPLSTLIVLFSGC